MAKGRKNQIKLEAGQLKGDNSPSALDIDVAERARTRGWGSAIVGVSFSADSNSIKRSKPFNGQRASDEFEAGS